MVIIDIVNERNPGNERQNQTNNRKYTNSFINFRRRYQRFVSMKTTHHISYRNHIDELSSVTLDWDIVNCKICKNLKLEDEQKRKEDEKL